MKRLGLICCLIATPGIAETPERIVPEAALSIAVGQAETLKFKSPFQMIAVASQGIVEATAQSDHTLTLFGKSEGVTNLSVRTEKGEEIYNATVAVTAEPGRVVRLYGNRKDIFDYVGYYCTANACGRADKELNGARDVTSRTVTTLPFGGSSTTQTYGR